MAATAAFAILGGTGLMGVGIMRHGDGNGGSSSGRTSTADSPVVTASVTPSGPSPAELAKRKRAEQVKALDAALDKYAVTVPEFSVAVFDRKTGQLYAYRGSERYETASVVKVQVLACLLLTAQDKHRDLTRGEVGLAQRMIQESDNAATSDLFAHLGRSSAISRCNKRMGLTQTTVNSSWGLTKTTVTDQVRLLDRLVNTGGPLDEDSREFAYDLMSTVDEDQDWGVPAAARPGEKTTVKNGWLPRSTEGNRWIINSVGRVTGGDTDVSIAVLSHNHRTMSGGIRVVEKAAKLTRQYLKY